MPVNKTDVSKYKSYQQIIKEAEQIRKTTYLLKAHDDIMKGKR